LIVHLIGFDNTFDMVAWGSVNGKLAMARKVSSPGVQPTGARGEDKQGGPPPVEAAKLVA
jgi:hypothetical protein